MIQSFKEIIECFREKQEITDELLMYMIESLAEHFTDNQNKIDVSEYKNLLTELTEIIQKIKPETMTKEQSYLWGAVWGSLNLLILIKENETMNRCV